MTHGWVVSCVQSWSMVTDAYGVPANTERQVCQWPQSLVPRGFSATGKNRSGARGAIAVQLVSPLQRAQCGGWRPAVAALQRMLPVARAGCGITRPGMVAGATLHPVARLKLALHQPCTRVTARKKAPQTSRSREAVTGFQRGRATQNRVRSRAPLARLARCRGTRRGRVGRRGGCGRARAFGGGAGRRAGNGLGARLAAFAAGTAQHPDDQECGHRAYGEEAGHGCLLAPARGQVMRRQVCLILL